MSRLKMPGPSGRFFPTWKFMKDPFVSYRQWKQKYGDTFLVKALNGNIVATCNTENIRRLFAAKTEKLEPFATETIKPLVGESSIFLLSGQAHRCERALVSSAFHQSGKGQSETIRDIAMDAARSWKSNEIISTSDTALDVSLEVIIRIVFGVTDQTKLSQFKQCTKEFVDGFHPTLAFTRLLHRPLLGFSPWARFVKAREKFHAAIDDEIDSRREHGSDRDDLLSRMMVSSYDDGSTVSKQRMREHLIAMLLAGHETTQIAIAWAMSWLHRNPQLLGQLREVLDECHCLGEIEQLKLLTGICYESLRINSVVSDTARRLTEPMEFVNHQIPAGTNIAIAFCLVHEDPDLYPDPFEFRPERWNSMTPKPHEFMPFGGGIRRCLGAVLAILEMKIVIATWVKNFDFQLPTNAPDVESVYRRNITMAPRSGIPLVFCGPRKKCPSRCE